MSVPLSCITSAYAYNYDWNTSRHSEAHFLLTATPHSFICKAQWELNVCNCVNCVMSKQNLHHVSTKNMCIMSDAHLRIMSCFTTMNQRCIYFHKVLSVLYTCLDSLPFHRLVLLYSLFCHLCCTCVHTHTHTQHTSADVCKCKDISCPLQVFSMTHRSTKPFLQLLDISL